LPQLASVALVPVIAVSLMKSRLSMVSCPVPLAGQAGRVWWVGRVRPALPDPRDLPGSPDLPDLPGL